MKKLFAITTTVGLLLFALPFVSQAAVVGTLTFSPNPVNQNQNVGITGSCGFNGANGAVSISVSNGSSQTSATTASSTGAFTANMLVDSTFPAGMATVTATCPNGDTVTGNLTVNAILGTTLGFSSSPTLGEPTTISGTCGNTAVGSNVALSLVRNGNPTSLGSTTTTDATGDFSGSVSVPATYGGGPVSVEALCPTGMISFNSTVLDPQATVVVSNSNPAIADEFTVSGVCGTVAGENVSFALSSAGSTTSGNLGTTLTTAGGTYDTTLTVPTTTPTGTATLTATCPSGSIATSALNIQPAAVSIVPPTQVSTAPSGGVAAGRTSNWLEILGASLLAIGVLGLWASFKNSSVGHE